MKTEYYDFHGKCSISSETLNRGFTPAAVAPPECDKLLDTCYINIAPERRGGKGERARSVLYPPNCLKTVHCGERSAGEPRCRYTCLRVLEKTFIPVGEKGGSLEDNGPCVMHESDGGGSKKRIIFLLLSGIYK